MFLLDWYKEWLSIRSELRAETKVCQSCETLKAQLEIANYEKKQLLDRIMTPPSVERERTIAPEPQAIRPKNVPWNVRRQMLEAEDREKARILKNAPKPDSQKADVAELERELDIASAEREAQTGTK